MLFPAAASAVAGCKTAVVVEKSLLGPCKVARLLEQIEIVDPAAKGWNGMLNQTVRRKAAVMVRNWIITYS